MQNSNPFPNLSSVPFPYCVNEAVARAYARARDALAGTAPSARDILAALAQAHALDPEQASGDTEIDADNPAAVAGAVDIAELLGVLREPIAWVFSVAERRAEGDPVDLAAIQRVSDGAMYRVDAIITGADPSEAPRIRATDVITVASLLVGTLDPAIIQRATQIIGGGITAAVSAVLPLAPAIASELASTPRAWEAPNAGGPVVPPWYGGHTAHAAVPFTASYPAPFGDPRVERAVVPLWPWLHSLFAF